MSMVMVQAKAGGGGGFIESNEEEESEDDNNALVITSLHWRGLQELLRRSQRITTVMCKFVFLFIVSIGFLLFWNRWFLFYLFSFKLWLHLKEKK